MADKNTMHRSVSAHLDGAPYTTRITAKDHVLIADEPLDHGGQDAGARPHELLLGALASCIAITLRMYAERKAWDTGKITVDVDMGRTQSGRDVESNIKITVAFEKELAPEQKDRLLQIAQSCPVHRTLGSPIQLSASLKA